MQQLTQILERQGFFLTLDLSDLFQAQDNQGKITSSHNLPQPLSRSPESSALHTPYISFRHVRSTLLDWSLKIRFLYSTEAH